MVRREQRRRELLMAHEATCMWDPYTTPRLLRSEKNTTKEADKAATNEPKAPKGEQGIH